MKRNQKGFGAVEGLLFLILLSILGFTGYYVYHSQKNTDSSYSNASKSNASTPVNSTQTNNLKFKELGVQITLPSSLSNLSYSLSSQAGTQYLSLSTPQFVNALEECNPGSDNVGAAFVSLDKKSGVYPANPNVLNNDGSLLKQFNGFYIEAQYPNGIGCSDTSKLGRLNDILSSSKKALSDAFKSATLIQ
jgi:hypothetical protein